MRLPFPFRPFQSTKPRRERRTTLRVESFEERLAPSLGDLLQTLNNPNPAVQDYFGHAVAIDGNLAVIGAYQDNSGSGAGVNDAGAAFVFDITTGALVATLNNPTPGARENFGFSVDISGTRVVVGEPFTGGNSVVGGRVYVFDVAGGGTPAPIATINNPDLEANDEFDFFGWSVAISGSRIVVGSAGIQPGFGVPDTVETAYVYDVATGPTPTLIATLNNPNPSTSDFNDFFSASVDIDGKLAVIGAGRDSPGGVTFAGSAYVFDVTAGATPAPLFTLNNPTPATNEFYGSGVAISGTRVVVGAYQDAVGGISNAGAAYVYDVSGVGSAPLVATLNNPAPVSGTIDNFGEAVSISGNFVVVGAFGDTAGGVNNAGAAFLFNVSGGGTPAPLTILTTDPDDGDRFGRAVSISGGRAVVGASHDDAGGVNGAGQAYVFDVVPTSPPPTPPTISDVANQSSSGTSVGPIGFTIGDVETASDQLSVTRASSNPSLLPLENIVLGGSGANRTVSVAPAAGQTGVATVTLTVTDAGGLTAVDTFVVTVTGPVNTAPTISDVANQSSSGTPVGPIGFTTGDAETASDQLSVTSASSNTQLLPLANIVLGGSGANRTVTMTPVAGLTGVATVTLTVTDAGGLTAVDTFVVTVTDPPGGPPIATFAAGGSTNGTVELARPTGVTTVDTGIGRGVRTATADVTGDGIADTVAGGGPGGSSRVVVIDGATGLAISDFDVFEVGFNGGVFVAAADLNADGKAEVIVTPDRGGGPVVAIYDGALLTAGQNAAGQLTRFFGIEDPNFRGGARAAAGDVSGDGKADLLVAAGFGGGPRLAVFDGTTVLASVEPGVLPPKLYGDFFVFEPSLRNGVFVAAGDLSGDGVADVVVGGGPGGGPRVFALDGKALMGGTQTVVANFFAGDPNLRGGVRVAVQTGTDGPTLVTGSGDGEAARIRLYLAATARAAGNPDQELIPFEGVILADGVYVG